MYKNGKNRTVKTFQKYFQGEVWNAKFRLTGQMYTECLDPPKKSDFGWYFLLVSTENEGGFFQGCGFLFCFWGRDLKDFRMSGVDIYRTRHTIYDWRRLH